MLLVPPPPRPHTWHTQTYMCVYTRAHISPWTRSSGGPCVFHPVTRCIFLRPTCAAPHPVARAAWATPIIHLRACFPSTPASLLPAPAAIPVLRGLQSELRCARNRDPLKLVSQRRVGGGRRVGHGFSGGDRDLRALPRQPARWDLEQGAWQLQFLGLEAQDLSRGLWSALHACSFLFFLLTGFLLTFAHRRSLTFDPTPSLPWSLSVSVGGSESQRPSTLFPRKESDCSSLSLQPGHSSPESTDLPRDRPSLVRCPPILL